MPSPLAHIAAGLLIGYTYPQDRDGLQDRQTHTSRFHWLQSRELWAAAGLSLLPDLDAAIGVLAGDFGRFHNNLTHSLFIGLVVALGIGLLVSLLRRGSFRRWFFLVLLCYWLHVVMDAFAHGRGVLLLWPFSQQRYSAPLTIFHGVRWSDGLVSVEHIWTIANELGFVLLCGLLLLLYKLLFSKTVSRIRR